MLLVVPLFEMHQPKRLRRIFGKKTLNGADLEAEFFDDELNRKVFLRVAKNCYLPGLKAISQGIAHHGFKCAIGISGTLMEQSMEWCPEVIDLLDGLARSGRCEFVGQTYYHSLACLIDEKEFMQQAEMHRRAIKKLFGVDAATFKNTGHIYSNSIAEALCKMGYSNVIVDGSERLLSWRSPNYAYMAKAIPVKVLTRNYIQSDIVNFRFARPDRQVPGMAAKEFVDGLSRAEGDIALIEFNLETFGEHFSKDVGAGDFLKELPIAFDGRDDIAVETPSEASNGLKPVGVVEIEGAVSDADLEKDLSAWLGNDRQRYCFETVKYLRPIVETSNERMVRIWRLFTQSDNFQYMSAKGGGTGAIHAYFSHFDSPVEAFISMLWALTDFRQRLYAVADKRSRYFRMLYGELPEGHAFHFAAGFALPSEATARNLLELRDAVRTVRKEALAFHVMRGDLSKWTDEILGCIELATEFRKLEGKGGTSEELRKEMLDSINAAIIEAKRQLGDR